MQKRSRTASEALVEAMRQAAVLRPLLAAKPGSKSLVQAAAQELGVSERQIYGYVRRLRIADGDVSVLLPRQSAGGRGKSRLAPATQDVVQHAIDNAASLLKFVSLEQTIRNVQELCRKQKVKPPSRSTLRRRIMIANAIATPAPPVTGHDIAFDPPSPLRHPGQEALSNTESLLGVLYDSITDDRGWAPFLSALAGDYAGGMATLYVHDTHTGDDHAHTGGLFADDMVTSYNQYYASINPWRGTIRQRPVGRAVSAEFMLPRTDLVKTEFFSDWLRPQGLASGVGATIQQDSGRVMAVSVLFPAQTHDRDPEAVPRLDRLVPHLLRAAQLRRQFTGLQGRASAAEAGLECLATGVVVVDHDYQVIYLNNTADRLISANDGISILRATLHLGVASEQHLFRTLLKTAVLQATLLDAAPGGAMRASRPSGRMAYEILVGPLAKNVLGTDFSQAAAIVFLKDPEASPNASTRRLRQLYALTASEARVMAAILDGKTLAEIAEHFGRRLETVRSQLKAILQKTGEDRQIDLVRRGWHGLISLPR